jgi:ankyrin repeat protein
MADGIYDQLPIAIPELHGPDASHIPMMENLTEFFSNQEGLIREPYTSRTPALNPIHTESSHCGLGSLNRDILEGTSLLSTKIFSNSAPNINKLSEYLEPFTIENVHHELIRKAETIFHTDSSDNLPPFLSLCIYLSSNNLLPPLAMDRLVMLLAKSNSHLRLETLLKSKSQSTTMEIFMSDLLASAATLGNTDITRILINHGADLDATRGRLMRATPLSLAIKFGHFECVRLLLEAGSDPNLATEEKTPLQIACSTRKCPITIVELLLKSGAHINPPQDSGRLTALQLAVNECQINVVRLLLQWKADPNTFTTSKIGTPLQIACRNSVNAEMSELLINAGADIDTCSGHKYDDGSDFDSDSDFDFDVHGASDNSSLSSFQSAILIAADNENWETVQLLLEEGADVNPSMSLFPIQALRDEFHFNTFHSPVVLTPLQAAVRAENITMTRMLLSAGAHVDARPESKYGHTALQIAAMMGNQRLVQILLRKGADINAPAGVFNGSTALQAAAFHSDTELLTFLLKEKSNVNAPRSSEYGKSALEVAISKGNIDAVRILLDACASANIKVVLKGCIGTINDLEVRDEIFSLLMEAGARFESPAGSLHTAVFLHAAVYWEDIDMTRRLLKRGADPNTGYCQTTNRTPLQQASSAGNEALIHLLISHGADINAPAYYNKGETALQSAALQGHLKIVKFLLDSGADARAPVAFPGGSAVGAAIRICNEELVQTFLDRDPEIISSDPSEKLHALRAALRHWSCTASIVRLLLKNGAAVNTPPKISSWKQCLQIAVEKGNFETVQCLLTAGADVNRRWRPEKSAARVTALQAAVFSRNVDIVRMLIEWGADVNAPAHNNAGGQTALQIAVSQKYFEMVQLLVQNGADVNGAPSLQQGLTALQAAAAAGNMKLTQFLLNQKADVNAPAAHFGGMTALQGAAIKGNIRIVTMLLAAGADIGAAPAIENGRSAIEGAAENGRLDTLHLLLNYHPNTEEFEIKKKRASKLALANGHLAIGRFLMAYRKSDWK